MERGIDHIKYSPKVCTSDKYFDNSDHSVGTQISGFRRDPWISS